MQKPAFGLALDFWSQRQPFNERLDDYLRVIALAERLGFDSVWAGENRPRAPEPGHVASPFLALASIARHTRLRLGTGVALITIRNPLQLAYDTAFLDQLTEGRFVLGVGMGVPPLMQRYGVDPANPGLRMDETLACLRALWSGESAFEGSLIKVKGKVLPAPRTEGGPTVLVGGARQRSADRAARLGDGWYGATQYRFERIRTLAGQYRAARTLLGQDGTQGTVAVNRTTFVAESDEVARREASPYVNEVMNFYASFGSILDAAGKPVPAGSDFVNVLDDNLVFVGSPDAIAASIAKYVDAGVNLFNLRVAMGDMPVEKIERTVRLLGEQVLPRFRQS